jgi:hypothetical protein
VDEILSASLTYTVNNGMSELDISTINIRKSFSKKVSFTLNVLNICNYGGKYYKAITTFLVFPFQILWITWHGSFTSGGHVGNLSTLVRTGDSSVAYDTNTGDFTVFGKVELSNLYVRHMSAYLIAA